MGRWLYLSDSNLPEHNLAAEEILLESLLPDDEIIFLYRNQPSLIIGAFQNPWLEADYDWAQANGVPIIRRTSGGGTVWHDLGNLNIAWMGARRNFLRKNLQLLIQAVLEKLGLTVSISDHGDLLHGQEKLSGNAFSIKHDRVLHHATLLISANLGQLRRALKPELHGWQINHSRGVVSRRMPVCQISDLLPDYRDTKFFEDFQNELANIYRPTDHQVLNQTQLPNFQSVYAKYQAWDWNFGKTPEFSVSSPNGQGSLINLNIREGRFAAPELKHGPFPGFASLANIVQVGFNTAR